MRNVFLVAVAALVSGVVTVACSGGGNLCESRNVRCESPLACDPDDGVCKCGGAGGQECQEGFACDADSNTCLSTLCAGVSCGGANQNGYDCDRFDGTCKCGGTGGTVCAEGELCNPATKSCQPATSCDQIACPLNMVCDPTTVSCLCGTGSCPQGQACSIAQDGTKVCAEDLCSGVTCLGATACDPTDGRCKCNGVACQSGELCGCPVGSDAGTCDDSQRTCRSGSACANVVCEGGTTCDPADGRCKCGGPGGPACGTQQVCSLQSLQCQGGNQCLTADGGNVACAGGTSCDPEDGQCKCGGRGGDVCAPQTEEESGETCVQSLFSQACRQRCDVRLQDCPSGQYCYWDTTSKTPTAYCAVPSGNKQPTTGCTSPTECFATNPTNTGVFCHGLGNFENPGNTGFCRRYCDTTVGAQSCFAFGPNNVPLPPQKCTPLTSINPNAPAGWGFCENA